MVPKSISEIGIHRVLWSVKTCLKYILYTCVICQCQYHVIYYRYHLISVTTVGGIHKNNIKLKQAIFNIYIWSV